MTRKMTQEAWPPSRQGKASSTFEGTSSTPSCPLLSTEPWLRSWDLLGPRRQLPLAQWKQIVYFVL